MRKMRIILFSVIYALVIVSAAQRRPPNYSQDEMPRTSFSCRDKIVGGYYADPETDCQMFHVCVRVAGLGVQDFRFLCPNDTSFDQENQICDDWYNIDCEASTLYYSDNFDLYRIADGVPEFGPSRATPIPLGPSSIAPLPYNKPKQRPHKPVNNAVSDDDDDSYLFKADSGDRRLQKDLLRGSSSGNFFANKNQGKEDEYDDIIVQDPTKNQLNTQSKKKQNKGVVRKLLTGKRPIQNQEISTTAATIVSNPFNNVGARNKYNTVQRNRQTTPVPTESTANNYYQSTAAAVNNYNNYNARNNYNTNAFNNYQTSSTTIVPSSGTYNNAQSSGAYNNFKSRGNVNYNTYTNKQPETTINYYNQQQSTTVAPVQNYNNNYQYNNNNNNNYNYNANQYQTTSTANPFNNYYQSTNSETTKLQNYQQSKTTSNNNYYQQTPSTVNYNQQQYNNYNNNQQYNKSPSTDAYQQPTTVKPYSNNNYYQQQLSTTTVKPTVNNNYYSQQNYNNLNNQQSTSTTYNYDYYYQTSTTTPPPNYPSYYTTQATPFVNNYDQSSSTTQNSNYQTKNLYNYNLNAANTAAVAQASATNAAASFTNSQQNYDPYNSYHNNNNNNDKYDEPSYGESLKTAPSSNIKPSDINSLNQQTYQSQKTQNKLQNNNGFNTTVSTSYNFNTESQKTQPTSQKYQTTKTFQTTSKPNYYTVAVPTSKAINRNTQIIQQNNYQNQYVSSTPSAINRGNNFYATASSSVPIKPESKKPIAPQQSTTIKSTSTNSGSSKKEKDTSYDYAYYDDGSPSEYDSFDPVGEEFSKTHSKKAKRGIAKH